MFAIKKGNTEKRNYTVNILPCRINYNGPISTSKRYWNPSDLPDGQKVAFFRGKKLCGKHLRMPRTYQKVVLSKTDQIMPRLSKNTVENVTCNEKEQNLDEESDPIVHFVEEQSEFDSIVIWGHESLPDETVDPFARGIQEWIDFSALLHSYEDQTNDSERNLSVQC
ncbi:putative rna exonuclease 4 [Erysiphe necator]|uniref:Putative rna exonuclease 4 n=1 Tax=Uncinula necator TaxID=52586 RepID=A0A0B1PDP3_UNCNE|nr:putative rna exonuclease 4 [Erysiphe necator]